MYGSPPNEEHAGAQAAADQPGQLRGCRADAPLNLQDTADAPASQPGSAGHRVATLGPELWHSGR